MEDMHEFDNRIKRELFCKADGIHPSEEIFTQILTSIEKRQVRKTFDTSFIKYATALICAVFVIFGATFMLSADARTIAVEVINTVRTVFIIDKNDNVVEMPANEVFIRPAIGRNTGLSDADISKKMGIKVCFPQTLDGGFNLFNRAEAVGFENPLDYETYKRLESDVEEAIFDNDVFKSLDNYQPYRSAGSGYKNDKGVTAYIAIYNKILTISLENVIYVTETIPTKIGEINAQWLGISYADNVDEGDMTQKPVGKISNHLLTWTTKGCTYNILLKKGQTLSMEETVKIAESFMQAQK